MFQATVQFVYLAAAKAASGGFSFSATPSGADAPGSSGLQKAINGFEFYALLACGAGLLISAALWGAGAHGGNQLASDRGKSGILIALGAAFLIGASNPLLNYAFSTGGA